MLTVPVMVHLVDNINHARKIQHNLFQQKPVADYEKVKKRDYNINDVFDKTIRKFQKEYPMIARKYFRLIVIMVKVVENIILCGMNLKNQL